MRKLATAAAVSLALASGGAFGLGLGEIEMQSALNQPMDAEIPLTSVKPGELDGMIVQLASPEAFARAGIERSSVLTDLRFSVDQSSGVPVIKIESNRPVVEPFLNFLVEVDWPQGRMVREYTVLLDPPVFMSPSASERNASADQPAVVQGGETALVVPTPIERDVDIVDDGVVVELTDLEDATVEPVLSLDEATATSPLGDEGGEVVSLEELSDDSLLSDGSAVADGGGEVVSLSDLGAPNTDAIAQREAEAAEAFSLDDIQVEVAGSIEEVTDDVVIGDDGQPTTAASISDLTGEDGSTIVSLDDIEEPSQSVSTGDADNVATEVTVSAGDTLFEIARDNAPAGVTVQQMMMAMLSANEAGFINNNINLVRAGAILRIPDAEEANTLTQAQALAAISDQNQLWQDYRDSLRATAGTQVARNIAPQEQDSPSAEQESIETAALDSEAATEGLSEEAQSILNSAREEVLDREELRIVADNTTATTTASATADETTDTDAARIGEVNRKLQLAREELSSTRLRADDLTDQASELADTTDKLDAMVSLRQNEVARLEAQLEEARKMAQQRAEAEAEQLAATATEEVAEVADGAEESATEELADAAEGAVGLASDATAEAVDQVQTAVADAENSAEQVMDSGVNALTEAGETLGEVELLSSDEGDSAGSGDTETASEAPVETTQTWYQEFLQDPKRMAIAGLGALGLLGVIGTLLFRRKRRDPESSMLDGIDETEFNEEMPAEPDATADNDASRVDAASGAAAAAGAAGVAGVAASNALFKDKADDAFDQFDKQFDNASDDANDSTLAFSAAEDGENLPVDNQNTIAEPDDKDDTISEVDVYLAYGLHGQAEELLTKAIERKPDNEQYALKLLQTYHAQGNNEAFHQSAADFHARFGGDDNPVWPQVAVMGAELKPEDPLYAASQDVVSRVAGEGSDTMLGDNDFLPASDTDDSGSVSRDFGSADPAVDFDDDESSLLDESLDPAFAFDESDLEATGDFSAIADELAAENSQGSDDGSIDFPGFDESGVAANEALKEVGTSGEEAAMDDALSLEELDGLTESVDDLTLDLDQLSGDLELDSAELLNSDLSDLDIPDLTADNELLLDSNGAMGAGADEMDTMMDLAKAYIDMGDKDSASSALDEIVKSGSPEQVTEAEGLLRKIS